MRTLLIAWTAAAAMALGASGVARAQSHDVAPASEFGTTADGQKFAFTDEQRVILRRYVLPRAPYGVTTGSAGAALTAGDRLPDSILLHPFPAAVYRQAPSLKPYRYIRLGTRAFAVDPRDRTIIEEID